MNKKLEARILRSIDEIDFELRKANRLENERDTSDALKRIMTMIQALDCTGVAMILEEIAAKEDVCHK